MKPRVAFIEAFKDLSVITLDLTDTEEALAIATQIEEHTVTVRDADGEILDRIKMAPRN